jgi:hypothetical protein
MTTHQTPRYCTLAAAAGRVEACPEDACPFWEPGGAVIDGRCAFERLDLTADASPAEWLLELRGRLEAACSVEEERAMRSTFHHLLNDSAE